MSSSISNELQKYIQSYIDTRLKTHVTPFFSHDVVRTFYTQIKTLIDECFQSLYRHVRSRTPGPLCTTHHTQFSLGLDTFSNPSKAASIMQRELERATRRFPQISLWYRHAMIQCAKMIYEEACGTQTIRTASFKSFLSSTFTEFSNSEPMRSLSYFTSMTFSEKEVFLMDTLRLQICASITLKESDHISTYGLTPQDSVSHISSSSKIGEPRTSSVYHDNRSLFSQSNVYEDVHEKQKASSVKTQRYNKDGIKPPKHDVDPSPSRISHQRTSASHISIAEISQDAKHEYSRAPSKRQSSVTSHGIKNSNKSICEQTEELGMEKTKKKTIQHKGISTSTEYTPASAPPVLVIRPPTPEY